MLLFFNLTFFPTSHRKQQRDSQEAFELRNTEQKKTEVATLSNPTSKQVIQQDQVTFII